MQQLVSGWTKEDLPFTLSVANRVLVSKLKEHKVNEEYTNQLKLHYNAVVDEVDFVKDQNKVTAECNEWVKTLTKGKIAEILKSIDPSTVAILINAIYFKGVWEVPFKEEFT
ncbi:leukocyte elastase inhibitor-like protein, partial [Leptotrombidium deliense]